MLCTSLMTILLAGTLGCAQADPKPEVKAPLAGPKIEVTIKDVPATEGRPPRFAIEGRADVPNGHTLQLYLYFGVLDPGNQLIDARVTLRNGAFAQDFILFKKNNLAGPWILMTVYDPNLQPAGAAGGDPVKIVTPLRIGTEIDAQNERKIYSEQLAAEFRAVAVLGQEVEAKSASNPRPEGAAWKTLLIDWRKRAYEIQKRALNQNNPEYKVLGISLLADGGLEDLIHILHAAAKCAEQGQHANVVQGVQTLTQKAQRYAADLASPRLTEPQQIFALIRTLRDVLRETLEKSPEPVLPRKRIYLERMQVLAISLPPDRHDLVQNIQALSKAFFDAASDGQPEAKARLEAVDKALEALAGTLPR